MDKGEIGFGGEAIVAKLVAKAADYILPAPLLTDALNQAANRHPLRLPRRFDLFDDLLEFKHGSFRFLFEMRRASRRGRL